MLSKRDQEAWGEWVNQVAVIGFNSEKYDLNMIKQYFLERIAENVNGKIKVAKKDSNYMFLTMPRFKFLDIKNFLEPNGLWKVGEKSIYTRIDELLNVSLPDTDERSEEEENGRAFLINVINQGKGNLLPGKYPWTVVRIKKVFYADIDKLKSHFVQAETNLKKERTSKAMSKEVVNLYSTGVSKIVKIDSIDQLREDIDDDPMNQVAVIGFNSEKYDLNMIKQYFLERIAENVNGKIKVVKKDSNYMFLTMPRFKFLDI